MRGRIYISEQGINAQYGGVKEDAVGYAQWLEQQPMFKVRWPCAGPAMALRWTGAMALRWTGAPIALWGCLACIMHELAQWLEQRQPMFNAAGAAAVGLFLFYWVGMHLAAHKRPLAIPH